MCMKDVVFIGDHRQAALFHEAGIASYAPPVGHLAERVLAERSRCRVLAMTERTLRALPADLARELRASRWPRLEVLPEIETGGACAMLLQSLLPNGKNTRSASA
ncbi:MAG: hypothetical protein AUK37_09010 [Rhodobacterales bacterium CG2_30_65_12]|nr:MAG: hypothetical protein AUK37_09010 [Rhodobacterales bacterium CG2_30_65_12]